MNIKNTKQTSNFQVARLIVNQIPKEQIDEINLVLSNYQGEEQTAKLLEVAAKFPESLQKELASYGCKLPMEFVACSMTTGSFLYDLYLNNLAMPEAPLNRKALEMKVMRLAEECQKEEISLPQWATDQISKNLQDESLWSGPEGCVLTLTYTVDGQEKVAKVNKTALNQFPVVISEVLAVFAESLTEQ